MEMSHERHVNLSIRWNRWILKPMGLWPKSPNSPAIQKCLYLLINAVCYSLISFLLIPCGLFSAIEMEDVYITLRLLGPMSFCVMGIIKYFSLISHGKDIKECVERIERDWRNVRHVQDRDVMIANAKFGRKLMIVSCFFMYGGFVFYYVLKPMSAGRVTAEDENTTFIPTAVPVSKYIIDTRYTPANEIVFFLQVLAGLLIHSIGAAACSLAAAFAVHANGQMEILICWLKHLINGREDMCGTVDSRVVEIVKQHMRILKFLTITEKTLRHVSLVEFLGSIFNMCMLGYYIIMESGQNNVAASLTFTLILTSFTFNIFIFCYIGELVACQWKMIGQMSYLSDWYQLPGKRKLSFILIIAMSNTSKKLTAGNIVELSLNTFSDVIKTSFGFFNMLRTLTLHGSMYLWSRTICIFNAQRLATCNPQQKVALVLHATVAIPFTLLSFLFIPCSLYTLLEVKDIYGKLQLVGPLVFCVMAYGKYYFLISHSKDIRECIDRIEWDWRNMPYEEDRDIMVANANFGKRLVIFCTIFMYSSFAFYFIAMPITAEREFAMDDNVTFASIICPTTKYVINKRYSTIIKILFLLQWFGGALLNSIAAATCSLIAVFALHACGQMEVLMAWLNHLIDGREDMRDSVNERTMKIVSQHVKILKFMTVMERALSHANLVEFLGCTVDLCLLGYYIHVEMHTKDVTSAVTYIVIYITFMINIFIFCYIGELVAERRLSSTCCSELLHVFRKEILHKGHRCLEQTSTVNKDNRNKRGKCPGTEQKGGRYGVHDRLVSNAGKGETRLDYDINDVEFVDKSHGREYNYIVSPEFQRRCKDICSFLEYVASTCGLNINRFICHVYYSPERLFLVLQMSTLLSIVE